MAKRTFIFAGGKGASQSQIDSLKQYVDDTVAGAGAVAGKPCTIQSVTDITGGHRVTFAWTDNSGGSHTSSMDVMDGTDGRDGADAPSISGITLLSDNSLRVTLSDGSHYDTTPIPTVKGDKGDDGESGEDGFSPEITVKESTESNYILHIKTKDDEFDTVNLKGFDTSALQTKALSSSAQIGDTECATVEEAVSATAGLVPSTATSANKLATAEDIPAILPNIIYMGESPIGMSPFPTLLEGAKVGQYVAYTYDDALRAKKITAVADDGTITYDDNVIVIAPNDISQFHSIGSVVSITYGDAMNYAANYACTFFRVNSTATFLPAGSFGYIMSDPTASSTYQVWAIDTTGQLYYKNFFVMDVNESDAISGFTKIGGGSRSEPIQWALSPTESWTVGYANGFSFNKVYAYISPAGIALGLDVNASFSNTSSSNNAASISLTLNNSESLAEIIKQVLPERWAALSQGQLASGYAESNQGVWEPGVEDIGSAQIMISINKTAAGLCNVTLAVSYYVLKVISEGTHGSSPTFYFNALWRLGY